MIEQKIYNLLKNDSAITTLVGNKIFIDLADETTCLPYIVINFITIKRDYCLNSISNIKQATIQISIWAKKIYDAIQVQNAVLNCLDIYTDDYNPSDTEDIYIRSCLSDNIGELFDYEASSEASKKYGRRIEFNIMYDYTY